MAKNSRNSSETKAKNRVSDNMQDAYDTTSRNKMTDKESERSENTWEKMIRKTVPNLPTPSKRRIRECRRESHLPAFLRSKNKGVHKIIVGRSVSA